MAEPVSKKRDTGTRRRPATATIASQLRRGRRKILEVGPLYAMQLVLERLVPEILFQANAVVLTVNDLSMGADPGAPDRDTRWATVEDLDLLATSGGDPAELRARFARRGQAAILEEGGKLVAYRWYEPDYQDAYDWLRYVSPPNSVINSLAWVAPESRGQGVFARLKSFSSAEHARNGVRQAIGAIDLLNRNSLKASLRQNQIFGGFWFVRVLGLTILRAPGYTRIGWWGPGRRLELPLAIFDAKRHR